MRTMLKVSAAIAVMMAGSGTAGAQAFNGAAQIAQGDYAAAEHAIVAQRGLFPDATDLLLNLATVYVRTGRPEAARRIYLTVMARPDEEVVLRDSATAWTHALATDAMRRLPTLVAAR